MEKSLRFASAGDGVYDVDEESEIWKKALKLLTSIANGIQSWVTSSSWTGVRENALQRVSPFLTLLKKWIENIKERMPFGDAVGQQHGSGRNVLDVLPKELWLYIGEKIEDPEDWLSFIRMSVHLEKLMEPAKTDKLFPHVLKHIVPYLDVPDLLNLRVVNKKLKRALDTLDSLESSSLKPFLTTSMVPQIYLTDLMKISRFTKDMSNNERGPAGAPMYSSPIPFTILVGAASPSDTDCRECDDEDYTDKITCRVFWKAFALCTEKIGHRIKSIKLDIRVDPQHGTQFAESIVNVIVAECLPRLPNLQCGVIITNTLNVEKALAGVYSLKDSSAFASFNKLETFEVITLAEGHPSKAKFKTRQVTFPSRFLRKHGDSVRYLRIFSNLYDFRTMDSFQVPKLEKVFYEIHHCMCQGKEADLKALLSLPVVKQEEDADAGIENSGLLNTILVEVNWQWRTSDISCILKWIGKHYPHHQLKNVTLRHPHNPLESIQSMNHHLQEKSQASCSERLPRYANAYGSDFPWLSQLSLPSIQNLQLLSEYSGSWKFLKALRGNLELLRMQKQEFYLKGEELKKIYKQGFVTKIFSEEALDDENGQDNDSSKEMIIWDYFPKLKELSVVWSAINYEAMKWNVENLLTNDEAYKSKNIISKMVWKLTRQDYREYMEESNKSNAGESKC